ASVGHTLVGGATRLEVYHTLERPEGMRVAAELDLGVTDDPVRVRGEGSEALGEPPDHQGATELMLRQCERAEPLHRQRIAWLETAGGVQRARFERHVGGIAGLAPPLSVCEAEQRQRFDVAPVTLDCRLEPLHGGDGVARRKPAQRAAGGCRCDAGRPGGRRLDAKTPPNRAAIAAEPATVAT